MWSINQLNQYCIPFTYFSCNKNNTRSLVGVTVACRRDMSHMKRQIPYLCSAHSWNWNRNTISQCCFKKCSTINKCQSKTFDFHPKKLCHRISWDEIESKHQNHKFGWFRDENWWLDVTFVVFKTYGNLQRLQVTNVIYLDSPSLKRMRNMFLIRHSPFPILHSFLFWSVLPHIFSSIWF